MKKILDIFEINFNKNSFVKAVFSNPYSGVSYKKINLKPIKMKNEILIQFELFNENKAFHQNKTFEQALIFIEEIILNFKQILVINLTEELQVLKKNGGFSIKRKVIEEQKLSLSHNKIKNYILEENKAVPFLIELGVMTSDGKVIKDKYSKFKQINKYLEFIEHTIQELQDKKMIGDTVKVVDFGCGKSYLTFALYHYLKNIKKLKIEVVGLDLKKDVIEYCNKIATKLNFTGLNFSQGNIKDFSLFDSVDIIFSLHACNIATDYTILKGLELKAKAILIVPCCQSEINQKIIKSGATQLKQELSPFINHGVLQERFSSLATDALRAIALELCGFNTKVMEFIDMEHTPKNILIKAVKDLNISEIKLEKKRGEYERYLNFLGVNPIIDTLLRGYFKK